MSHLNYFVTEMGFRGKLDSSHTNMRAAETWIKYLDAYHLNIFDTLSSNDTYGGTCWLIIPKGEDAVYSLLQNFMNTIQNLKTKFDTIHCIQEGEIGYWNQMDVTTQTWIYLQFSESDKIYTQNESDVDFFKGMFPEKEVLIIRPVMDESVLDKNNFKKKENRCIISGPFTREYYGFHQMIIAQNFNCPIDVPPMGETRMPKDSWDMADNVGVSYLKYMMWKEWMENLSRYKFGVMMIPAVGSGTFALNCGYHSIPCIGNNKSDTQKLLFPDLSVDHMDLKSARELSIKLRDNESFYKEVSDKSKSNFNKYFCKEVFFEELKYG